MASPFSSIFSNTPSSWNPPSVTTEQFNAFHKIDRTLFARLVFALNRDINHSYQVVGFLILLEKNNYVGDLIASLDSVPDSFVDALANEVLVCLSFLFNKDYFSSMNFGPNNNYDQSVIPLITRFTEGKLSLSVIDQQRKTLLLGLKDVLTDVCDRAFEDLSVKAEMYNKEKLLALEREKALENLRNIRLSVRQGTFSRSSVPQGTTRRPGVQQVWVPTPPPVQGQSIKKEEAVEETAKEEEEVEIAADDRTVFLTFSKGYPISEEQVRVYFTRKFGEVIESVEMQEVEEEEQPLYARMVLKMCYVSKMEEIVCGRSRNKFTIDGKHVWARKYVRKSLASASAAAASPSTSQT